VCGRKTIAKHGRNNTRKGVSTGVSNGVSTGVSNGVSNGVSKWRQYRLGLWHNENAEESYKLIVLMGIKIGCLRSATKSRRGAGREVRRS